MNKDQFIEAVVAATGLSKKDSAGALEAMIETVTKTLERAIR